MTLLFILNPKIKKIVLNGNCRNMFKLKSAEIANVVLLFEKKERRIDRHFTIFFVVFYNYSVISTLLIFISLFINKIKSEFLFYVI